MGGASELGSHDRIAWHARLILLQPARVLANLRAVAASPRDFPKPTLWQIELAVLRIDFESELAAAIASLIRGMAGEPANTG